MEPEAKAELERLDAFIDNVWVPIRQIWNNK